MKLRMLLSVLLAVVSMGAQAITRTVLLDGVTTTATSAPFILPVGAHTFSCYMTVSSGSGSATVIVEASQNSGVSASWSTIVTLTPTDTAADAATDDFSRFVSYRARVTGLSGTGAALTCIGGA